jgi:anti-sigma-K factor RskA
VSERSDRRLDERRDWDDRPTQPGYVPTPHDSLGAYALGALDSDERRMFELHMFICAACRADLAAHERVAGLLPYGLPPQQPPEGARDRLLTRARADTSESPTITVPVLPHHDSPTVVDVTPTVVEQAAPGDDGSEGPTTGPLPSASPRRGLRIKLASIGWAAALLLVIASGIFFAVWSTTGPHASFEVEALARLPGGQIVNLRGTGVPSASARLYVVEAGRRAELTIDALPPLPPGRTYQLWFAEPNQATRTGGAFGVDQRGDASVRVTIPTPLERVRAISVTQEPAPGLAAPTGVHLLDWIP